MARAQLIVVSVETIEPSGLNAATWPECYTRFPARNGV